MVIATIDEILMYVKNENSLKPESRTCSTEDLMREQYLLWLIIL